NNWLAIKVDITRAGVIKPGKNVKQCTFSTAGWPDNADKITITDTQINGLERFHCSFALAELLGHLLYQQPAFLHPLCRAHRNRFNPHGLSHPPSWPEMTNQQRIQKIPARQPIAFAREEILPEYGVFSGHQYPWLPAGPSNHPESYLAAATSGRYRCMRLPLR